MVNGCRRRAAIHLNNLASEAKEYSKCSLNIDKTKLSLPRERNSRLRPSMMMEVKDSKLYGRVLLDIQGKSSSYKMVMFTLPFRPKWATFGKAHIN